MDEIELSDDFIDGLLAGQEPRKEHVPTPVKTKTALKFDPENNPKGVIRYYDKEMRCASRGCSSPTYIKVNGVPRCSAHALREANDMLHEAGFRGI